MQVSTMKAEARILIDMSYFHGNVRKSSLVFFSQLFHKYHKYSDIFPSRTVGCIVLDQFRCQKELIIFIRVSVSFESGQNLY